jgi:hypothetical protein
MNLCSGREALRWKSGSERMDSARHVSGAPGWNRGGLVRPRRGGSHPGPRLPRVPVPVDAEEARVGPTTAPSRAAGA